MPDLDLLEQTCSRCGSEQIVGSSPALKSALAEVERVASTDATVLVLGETGTGKELFAHAVHNLSARCQCPFVKLDCAAIRFDLLESELFGHEKGAFPGAITQKIGCFEMANTGTLFLDEIGDFPLALQSKLLRILEEQEFERPGSGHTQRVNVRLVAATHRDLAEMVRQKEFRTDLYYRLNGFPVMLPPLRERGQDVESLTSHFVEVFSRRFGKRIRHIPEETLSAFSSHSWPGNVRELQNLIKRAVILSNDGVLPNPLPTLKKNFMPAISHEVSAGVQQATLRSNSGASRNPLPISGKHSVTTMHGTGRDLPFSDATSDPPIVSVIDEDASLRESMKLLILNAGWQPEMFARESDFLDRPRPLAPNCLMLDVSLEDHSRFDLQKRIAIERTETPIIFIAGQGDVPRSVQAMKAGAIEVLMKPFSDEAFLDAVREGLKRSTATLARKAEMRSLRDRYAVLSHRERQVMALVVTGLLNKQVGSDLGISESTVKGHRGRVMQKMCAKSVPDLVRMAAKLRSERVLASSELRSPSLSPATASAARAVVASPSFSGTTLAAVGRG